MTGEKITRGRMGRIQQLPQTIQDRIHVLLRGGVTQADILRQTEPLLKSIGEKPLSAAGLNRYAAKVEATAHRMRQAREMARVWKNRFGEDPDDDLTGLMVDMLQTEVFEAITRLQESDETLDAETVNQLALGMQRLARAAEISAKREREIRREAAERADRKLAEAENDVSGGGDPTDIIRRVRRDIYGIVNA